MAPPLVTRTSRSPKASPSREAGAGQTILNGFSASPLPTPPYPDFGLVNISNAGSGDITFSGFTLEGANSTIPTIDEPFDLMVYGGCNAGTTVNVSDNDIVENSTVDPNQSSDYSVGVYSLASACTMNFTNNTFSGEFQGMLIEEPESTANFTGNTFDGLAGVTDTSTTPSTYYWPEGLFFLADGGFVTNQPESVINNTFQNFAGMGVGIDGGYGNGAYTGDVQNVLIQGNLFNQQGATDPFEGPLADIFMHGESSVSDSVIANHAVHRPSSKVASHVTLPKTLTPTSTGSISDTSILGNRFSASDPGHGISLEGNILGGMNIQGNLMFGHGSPAPPDAVDFTKVSSHTAVTMLDNMMSGFGYGISADTLPAGAAVSSNRDCIFGNSTAGVENGDGATITASGDWWGAKSGPAPSGSGNAASANVTVSPALTKPAPICAVAVYRSSNSTFYMRNYTTPGVELTSFVSGLPSGSPLAGQWTSGAQVTMGSYSSGNFYLRNSNTTGPADTTALYGPSSGVIPIVGDWTGKGYDSVGVYNSTTAMFYLRNSNTTGFADIAFNYGVPGDIPLVGDWTHKGYDSVGVYRPSNNTFYLRNSNTAGNGDIAFVYGTTSDTAITGDWTASSTDTPGVHRGNVFYLRDSNTGGNADVVLPFGLSTDKTIFGWWPKP